MLADDLTNAYNESMFHEPDTSQNDDPDEIVQQLFPPNESDDQAAAPLRFSLAELLVATTIAAVLLALFRTLGIYGALLSFGAALIFTLGIYPAITSRDQPRQALIFDFVWGVVMPLVCLVFDPFVFKGSESASLDFPLQIPGFDSIQPAAYVAYPLLAWQLAVMGFVLVVGRVRAAWAAVLSGTLAVGLVSAGAMGIVLFPFSTLGLLALVGILGYTPLLTAFAFGRRTGEMWQQARRTMAWQRTLFCAALGATLAIVLPLRLGLFVLFELSWFVE